MSFWDTVTSAVTGAHPYMANAAQGSQAAMAGGIGPMAQGVGQWLGGSPASGSLWQNLGAVMHPQAPVSPALAPPGGYGTATPPPPGSGNWGGQQTGPIHPAPGMPQQGGVTRQGSQMIDANGQVIGHYGDQNQPVYNSGQGPQGPQFPGSPDWTPRGPDGNPDPRIMPGMPPWATNPGQFDRPGGGVVGPMPWMPSEGQPINPFDPTDYARFSSAYAPPANPLSGYALGRLGGR